MTIDYKALAERIKAHAECHSNVEPFDDEQRQWADDLRTVATMLEGMADAKPVGMFIKSGKPGDESYDLASRKYWGDPDLVPLYLHPAPQPQPQPIDPHMIAAEDRYPDEPTEAQIKARDALLDFISENGTASEGVQHYLDRYVRAALAAKD